MGFSGVLVLVTHYLIFFVAFCRLTASDYPFGIASNFSYGILNIFLFIEPTSVALVANPVTRIVITTTQANLVICNSDILTKSWRP
jgi:hypothetical protein